MSADRQVERHLDTAVKDLQAKFRSRVTIGSVKNMSTKASSTQLVVWGADARNWDVPTGTMFFPVLVEGEASVMHMQRDGMFGIVTTPRYGLPDNVRPSCCV